jgi:maltooligosyltrehalose trehalohydrolase
METVRRQHAMPYGATLLQDGRTRFRLWAPAATRVEVCLTRCGASERVHQTLLPMEPAADGCFDLATGQAGAGSRYHYRIDGGMLVPDPASRFQPEDVHGPSEVIDPAAWSWQDSDWRGRPWKEAVIYELHVGSFTPAGSFAAVQGKLDYLVELGITAIELMPVADFPGTCNWGYDGALLFAPDSRYGRPEALKALIDAAHACGLMVFLDVVYNHFGPEGNYLQVYAPQFFTERHHTPWGAAINFDGEHSHQVRQFFIHNALFWLEEYHLDGLRLDAAHAILDDSQPDILTELAQRVHEYFGDTRHIHLILENDHNSARYLNRDTGSQPRWYTAQWNDDFHHALHVLLTAESDGYYMDYTADPLRHLGRCLAEGFAYQGERSAYRNDRPRGESSKHLPATAFVAFLQNHDQVGNRAFGERISRLVSPERLHAAITLLLLAPSPPLLFMGEEWGCTQPFYFFCNFGPDFADKVVAGRRQEFARFPQFSDPESRKRIPDPMDPATFAQSLLDWSACDLPGHSDWLALHRELLALRRRELVPRLPDITGQHKRWINPPGRALSMRWTLGDESALFLLANLGDTPVSGITHPRGALLYSTHSGVLAQSAAARLPPWSVTWLLHAEAPVA